MKTIIIDDESWIRKLIIKLLPYDKYPINIVGEASNGLEGLNLIKELQPDVILTDIRMPKLSGLELIKNIKNINPNGQVIIISGYDNFEYAQEAIKLGVIDFVLKPVEKEKLEEAFNKANKLFKKNIKLKELSNLERQLKRLETEYSTNDSTSSEFTNIKNLKIKNALIFIEKNYSQNISMIDVCDYIAINSSYFSELFKKEVGIGYNQYLINRRLKEAEKLLLKNPNLNIGDIASIIGFQDSNYFSRLFKKKYNITPQEFRNRQL